jgi:hypothetical protein
MPLASLTETDRCLGPFDLAICPATLNIVVSPTTIIKTTVISGNREFTLQIF